MKERHLVGEAKVHYAVFREAVPLACRLKALEYEQNAINEILLVLNID